MKSSFYLKYALKQGAVAFALVAVIILIFGPISAFFLKEYTAVCLVIVGALLLLMLVPLFAAASLERRHGLLHPQPVDDAWRKRLFDNVSAIGTGVLLFALNLCSATLAFVESDTFRGVLYLLLAAAFTILLFGRGVRGLRKLMKA